MPEPRVFQRLASTSPKMGYDGQVVMPDKQADSPTFVPRLSFKIDELYPTDGNVSSLVAQIPSNASIFPDTNIWDWRLSESLWPTLLARAGGILVIPNVRMELDEWIRKNPSFPAAQATLNGQPPFVQLRFDDMTTDQSAAYEYYVNLLQLRRRVPKLAAERYENRTGYRPSESELTTEIQKLVGSRGLLLARKNRRDSPVDKWATDESLVYFAAQQGLRSGEPTVILTSDQDVLEQFYKLWWTLDTQYRAMLLAESYVSDPFAYPLKELPWSDMALKSFDRQAAVLVDRGPERMHNVLPAAFKFVAIECWLLKGNYVQRMTFGAETAMLKLLAIKGQTGGLVSADLSGRNLHPWLPPLPLSSNSLKNCFLIARDRTLPIGTARARIGVFDAVHVINTRERFSHWVRQSEQPQARLWTPGQST